MCGTSLGADNQYFMLQEFNLLHSHQGIALLHHSAPLFKFGGYINFMSEMLTVWVFDF